MNRVQQIEPITTIQKAPTEVLAMLTKGPVILAQRSRPAAVLVSVEQWDHTVELLEDLTDTVDALRMELAIAKGEVEVETFTADQLNQFIGADERVPA